MEKKYLFLAIFSFAFVFLLSGFVSPFSIQTKANYSGGENFIAKITGVFCASLTASNIHFYYKGHDETSFGIIPSPVKVDNYDYYLSFGIPSGKPPGNYLINVSGIRSGSSCAVSSASAPFLISNRTAFVSVSPALTVSGNFYYDLSLTDNSDNPVTVVYGPYENQFNNVTLMPYSPKNVTLPTPSNGTLETIIFSYGNETSYSFVYSTLEGTSLEVYKNGNSGSSATNQSGSSNKTLSIWDILFGGSSNKTSVGNSSNTTNSSSGSIWDLFGNGSKTSNQTNESNLTNSSSSNELQTCSQMGFIVCNSTQKCDGALVNGLDAQCCNGSCVAQSSGGFTLGIVGWIIIGIIILALILFFKFKFSRTKRIPVKLPGRIR
jgi:hypothetical protein